MTAPREPMAAPPTGYRPKIGVKTTLEAVLLAARCPDCGERLGSIDNVHRDHVPPLQMRPWCEETQDTIPPANDPAFIVVRHADCHRDKTTGGKTKAKAQGDTTEIYRTRRLAAEQAAFRNRLLSKGEDPEEPIERPAKRKSNFPSRPFPKRQKPLPTTEGR